MMIKKREVKELPLIEEIYQIYIMYFDQTNGIIPLLISPDESIKNNEKKIRPAKFHPIWYLETKNQNNFEHIDLVYDGKVYLAKKFQIFSRRKKKSSGLSEEIIDLIAIIVVLPKEIRQHGLNILNIISEVIINDFAEKIFQIIETGLLKENLIKTPKIREIIKKTDFVRDEIRILIRNIWENYFLSIKNSFESTN